MTTGAMTIAELTRHVQFIVDEHGNRNAAVFKWEAWEQILTILEDREDAEDLRLVTPDDEVIPWEQAKTELRLLPLPKGLRSGGGVAASEAADCKPEGDREP